MIAPWYDKGEFTAADNAEELLAGARDLRAVQACETTEFERISTVRVEKTGPVIEAASSSHRQLQGPSLIGIFLLGARLVPMPWRSLGRVSRARRHGSEFAQGP